MKTIAFFDWNGTLLKDVEAWHESVGSIFRAYGRLVPPMGDLIAELTGDYMEIFWSRKINVSREKAHEIYGKRYTEIIASGQVGLFEGAKETLEILHGSNVILGLVTCQEADIAGGMLDVFGLRELFKYQHFYARNKNVHIVGDMGLEDIDNPRNCFMVGDSISDIIAGERAGVRTIAFLNGYNDDVIMRSDSEPDYFASSLKTVQSIILGVNGTL